MICKTCRIERDSVKTIIKNGQLVTGCEVCLTTKLVQGHDGIARYNRENMKKNYRRELTQPADARNFIKAYPDKARDALTDEAYRRLS